MQKLPEFWTPLYVYKKCPSPPRQAGISCFTGSFPSQYQSEAKSLLHSQSIPLSLNSVVSSRLIYTPPYGCCSTPNFIGPFNTPKHSQLPPSGHPSYGSSKSASSLSTRAMKQLFNTVAVPRFTYGMEVWYTSLHKPRAAGKTRGSVLITNKL